jgi:Domain of unknown function (DUF1906)
MPLFRTISFVSLFLSLPLLLFLSNSSPQSNRQTTRQVYLGYDRNDYPGDDALPVLRRTFSFTSYWLSVPPGEKGNSWLGKRALLKEKGFGFLLLFKARESRNIKSTEDAHRKAEIDAAHATALAGREGFGLGSTIFLDIEEGGRLPSTYHDYIRTWATLVNLSSFHAGVYCSAIPVGEGLNKSITTVEDIQAHLDVQKVTFWVYNDACPPSPGCVFPQNPPEPRQSGYKDAQIWQYAQSPRRKQFALQCSETYAVDNNCYGPGDTQRKWYLDADVANSADPSDGRLQ